jgi:cytochrome c
MARVRTQPPSFEVSAPSAGRRKQRLRASRPTLLLALAAALAMPSTPSWPSQQLASDMGCYNCHAISGRAGAPPMARLAEHAAKARGDESAIRKSAEKLRAKSLLHPIAAHERLSPETAETLIRWLSEGAPALPASPQR